LYLVVGQAAVPPGASGFQDEGLGEEKGEVLLVLRLLVLRLLVLVLMLVACEH